MMRKIFDRIRWKIIEYLAGHHGILHGFKFDMAHPLILHSDNKDCIIHGNKFICEGEWLGATFGKINQVIIDDGVIWKPNMR